MWHLRFHPTAGFILNVAGDAAPGVASAAERTHLRELARRVAELAKHPKQQAKRNLWFRKIALEKARPAVLAFLEDSWLETFPLQGNVTVADPFWGQWEWYLKHLLYRDVHIDDDFVVEPELYVPTVIQVGDWGLPATEYQRSQAERGSYHWTPPLSDSDDLEKMRPASMEYDAAATRQRVGAVEEMFGDLLPVRPYTQFPSAMHYDIATHLRGIEQCMLDMYDRPEWLHRLMGFLADESERRVAFLIENNLLSLNNRNHYTDSGGIGYTRELPADGFDGSHVRPLDCWCHGVAQAASEIGPAQHEEFILAYDKRLLDRAGLAAYGCCEPYTHKFDMLKRNLPNLRRVSVSPWCDVDKAAEALTDRYVYSWKPNPALLCGAFSPEKVRPYIRRTLEAARDCCLEIILKDTITLDGQPQRLEQWLAVVREEIDGLWDDR